MHMRNRSAILAAGILAALSIATPSGAQTATAAKDAASSQNASSKIPDLSGDWGLDTKRGGIGQSISLSDPGRQIARKRAGHPLPAWHAGENNVRIPANRTRRAI